MNAMMSQLGNHAFSSGPSSHDAEAEYDRLRSLAHREHDQRAQLSHRSQEAYQSGDGASAKELSNQSKEHAAKADEYNRQASEYIFRENNAVGKVDADTIDLHGQFVEEAEEIFEQRVRYARSTNQSHLHVIVGKGNHSDHHVQKLKPRVERVCRELGLNYRTEDNEGRIYVELGGGRRPGQAWGGQNHGNPMYETAYPMGGGAGSYSHGGQPQGGYPAAQQQYGKPQEQMGYQEPQHGQQQQQQQQEKKQEKCCGLCVVM